MSQEARCVRIDFVPKHFETIFSNKRRHLLQNLMEVMMEYGVKRIVFSSSATVHGNPDYLPIDEKHPTGRCTNPYGKTKFFMEEIMKDVCAANKVFNILEIDRHAASS